MRPISSLSLSSPCGRKIGYLVCDAMIAGCVAMIAGCGTMIVGATFVGCCSAIFVGCCSVG